MAIGAKRFHELRHPQVQAGQVLRPAFRALHMHIVTGWTADVAYPRLMSSKIENRHFRRRARANRSPDILRPGDDVCRVLGGIRRIVVTIATKRVDDDISLSLAARPHERAIGPVCHMARTTGATRLEVLAPSRPSIMRTACYFGLILVAGLTHISTIGTNSHERLDLVGSAFRFVEVT